MVENEVDSWLEDNKKYSDVGDLKQNVIIRRKNRLQEKRSFFGKMSMTKKLYHIEGVALDSESI